VVDAGDAGFPRGRALVHRNKDDKAMLVVVAPPPDGRRSSAGGVTERQNSRYARCGGARGRNRAV
jgi:hypothetical protein